MDNLYHDNYDCFLFMHKTLKNKPLLSHSLKTFEHGFGLNFQVTNADILEYRPQITVRVGNEEDHIFEALLLANVDLPDTNVYNLKTLIISAATQLLLWRLWPTVDTSKSAEPNSTRGIIDRMLSIIFLNKSTNTMLSIC